jgi:hypothetical protein
MKRTSIISKFTANQNTKRGSYTLEAAIFLPVFIVGVLTLGFTMKLISTAENMTFAATDESRMIAAFAYNVPVAPFFPNRLATRIMEENDKVAMADVDGFRYLVQTSSGDARISFAVKSFVETGLPLGMVDGILLNQRFLCRGFVGRNAETISFPFDDMERNDNADMVWVFPDEGTRYHIRTCSIVSSYPVQLILNEEIRKRYKACELCHAADASFGTQVYCFLEYGENYHLISCPSVDKYVVSMTKQQAEDRGYTPCLKCGGYL